MSSPSNTSPSPASLTAPAASKNPKNLTIPTASSPSSSSPTTPVAARSNELDTPVDPRAATAANFAQYRINPTAAPAAADAKTDDEKALQNLSADDLQNNNTAQNKMGNVSEQSAMEQVLSGVLAMQKEVSTCISQFNDTSDGADGRTCF